MAGNGENEIFGTDSLFEEFADTSVPKQQPDDDQCDADSQGETYNEMKQKIDGLEQENLELRRHLRLLIHPGLEPSSDCNAPVVQVLFFDHDSVCFHRQQIEDFFELLPSLSQGDSKGGGVPDYVRPRPQMSSRLLRQDFREKSGDTAFTVTGNVQYYQRFCIDSLGRPLVDGNPQITAGWEVPCYTVIFHEALPIDETEKPSKNKKTRNKATCWNCGKEDHSLRDCPYPRDLVKISMAKKEFMEHNAENASLNQRYHVDGEEGDNKRFAQFKAGQIGAELREALNLDEQQIPPYIYQMRVLGYPPGYLKHAEVLKSGLTVYNMQGDDEPGQIMDQQAAAPTYDPSKLIEYPGFNVALPEGIQDPIGVPPMQPAHSKDAFQVFMTPPRGDGSASRKRGRRDFAEDMSKKRSRPERDEVDMDLESDTPGNSNDEMSRVKRSGSSDFKPPLPPTPVPQTPPPLPKSTPPVTPGNTPRLQPEEIPREGPDDAGWEESSQSSSSCSRGATPGSTSPSIDDLEMMQTRLQEALMQTAEDGGSAQMETDSASDRFVVDGEEFIVDSVSDDNADETSDVENREPKEPQAEGDGQTPEEMVCEGKTSEGKNATILDEDCQANPPRDQEEVAESTEGAEITKTPDQSPELAQEAADVAPSDANPESAGDPANLEPGEIPDPYQEDTTPNRSGVPHISKFAVGISPHENENLSESSGVLKRILGIFKRRKGKPST